MFNLFLNVQCRRYRTCPQNSSALLKTGKCFVIQNIILHYCKSSCPLVFNIQEIQLNTIQFFFGISGPLLYSLLLPFSNENNNIFEPFFRSQGVQCSLSVHPLFSKDSTKARHSISATPEMATF